MMRRKYKVLRDHEGSVPETSVKTGDTVYEFNGCTYGCIAEGVAVSKTPSENPFFELPANILNEVST